MMNYFDLTVYQRTLLMTALFVTASFSIIALVLIIKKRQIFSKILLVVGSLISGTLCIFYATEARTVKFSRELPETVKKVCKMPILISILLLVLCMGYMLFVFLKEWHDRRNRISRASVKESLDKLPTGLCFYQENGRIILVNNSMNALCHKIVGRDLQNAKLFWEILSEGEVLPEIERLERGENPSFRLTNGQVWSFARTQFDGVLQLTAANTTDLSNINAELKKKNAELAAINKRLREYGEQVDELTRTRERIDIKANIHRELGQALLITRRFVLDESGEAEIPVEIWKKNVAMLTREADFTGEETVLSQFLESAEASGVKVQITGNFPDDKKQNALFITAGVECLVNGVRHANATTLYITIAETEREISVTYENDGDLPTGEIIEGGGLSSLRHKANRLGGRMEVKAKPRFSLSLILPKKGGNA